MVAGISAAVILGCGVLLGQATSDVAPAPVPLHVGPLLAADLDRPFAATWENVNLRNIARRISATRHVAILLDRRLDPTCEHSLTAPDEPLRSFLDRLAERVGGMRTVAGNSVYLGPPAAARNLRTLIWLRQQELAADNIPRVRRFDLMQTATFTWEDLAQPADLVRRQAAESQLELQGLEHVPYDLWAGAVIPEATATQVLSLILIQFDLTFEWTDNGNGIRIVPVPGRVALERAHLSAPGQTAEAALAHWRQSLPDLEARIVDDEVLVRGTIEEHETIERLRRPPSRTAPPPAPRRLKPLKLERYTLRIRETPLRALLEKLSEPAYGQLVFDYDAEALARAGINLDQRVTFEVKTATIEQLLEAALKPVGLTFELDDRTARLKPAAP
jgi:hypothetical protein